MFRGLGLRGLGGLGSKSHSFRSLCVLTKPPPPFFRPFFSSACFFLKDLGVTQTEERLHSEEVSGFRAQDLESRL